MVRFGSCFPFKFNEQIDTRIDAEQVMKIMKKYVNIVLKSTRILIVSEVASRGNLSFLKKVDVRKPYDSCSGIRLGDGSRKKQEIQKIGKSGKRTFPNHTKHVPEK